MRQKPHPEHVVLDRRIFRLIAYAVFRQHRRPDHRRRVPYRRGRHEAVLDVAVFLRISVQRAVRRQARPPADHAALRVRVKVGDLFREPVGTADVVMVEDGKVLALRKVKESVARCGNAEVAVVAHIKDASILIALHHTLAVVVGAVVKEQKLEVAEGLRKDALNRLPQETLVSPVNRHQHRYLHANTSFLEP